MTEPMTDARLEEYRRRGLDLGITWVRLLCEEIDRLRAELAGTKERAKKWYADAAMSLNTADGLKDRLAAATARAEAAERERDEYAVCAQRHSDETRKMQRERDEAREVVRDMTVMVRRVARRKDEAKRQEVARDAIAMAAKIDVTFSPLRDESAPCPHDTNGDGDCGRPLCPHCGEYAQRERAAQDIRPSVMAFAREMERTLHRHSAKKGNQNGANGRCGWRQDPVEGVLNHLEEETRELRVAYLDGEIAELKLDCHVAEAARERAIASEAVDVANMAMMVWDRVLMRDDAGDPPDWDDKKRAGTCTIPPEGWRCTRLRGHDGPCAAVQDAPTPSRKGATPDA